MDKVLVRNALQGMIRATDDDSTPIIRRLARVQARAALANLDAEAASWAGERGATQDEFATVEDWEHDDQRELSLLYNHRADDSLQFNRGQMREAIRHGKRLASLPPATDPAIMAAKREAIEELTIAGYVMEWRGGYQVVWQGKEQREFFDDRDAAHESLARFRAKAILAALAAAPTIPATGEAE